MNEAGVGYVPGGPPPVRARAAVPVADNLVLTQLLPVAVRARASCATTARSRRRPSEGDRQVRHPDAVGRRRRRARCRAATSRRWSSRASSTGAEAARSSTSRRADSTSAASSSSIARRSASATRAPPILLVSAELDEVLELSDRIAVMYRGRIVAMVDGRTADKNEVGLLMATGGRDAPRRPTPTDDGRRRMSRRAPRAARGRNLARPDLVGHRAAADLDPAGAGRRRVRHPGLGAARPRPPVRPGRSRSWPIARSSRASFGSLDAIVERSSQPRR